MKGCLIAIKNLICSLFMIGGIWNGMRVCNYDTWAAIGYFAIALVAMYLWTLGED